MLTNCVIFTIYYIKIIKKLAKYGTVPYGSTVLPVVQFVDS